MSQYLDDESRKSFDGPSLYADGALGLFTVIALIMLVWGFCWFKSYSSWRVPQRVRVVFKEVAGLNVHAGVFVDGVRVGIVDRLEWQGEHRVLVGVRINAEKITVPRGSKFVILTNGIVGAKYVEIQFPDHDRGTPPPPPLGDDVEVDGEDPVRPELAVNNIAIGLSNIDMQQLSDNVESDRARLVLAADQLAILGKKTMPIVDRALPLADELLLLCKDIRQLTSRANKFLDNPKLPADLKETAEKAKQTVETARDIVHELNATLKDASLRKDLISTVDKLSKAATSVQASVEIVEKVAGDKELRGDIKQILLQARTSLNKVDEILNKPAFKEDLGSIIGQAKQAVDHVDLAARQLNQILNKRFPLVKMMIGRPGHIEKEPGKIPPVGEKKQGAGSINQK